MSREADLFDAACDRPPADRDALLDRECTGDPALRARVEGLLAGYAEVERILPSALVPRGIPMPEEMPGDLIGRYKLLEKIGEGGCGSVWMAGQETPVRRTVALKVIKLGMDTKAVIARFEAERQALALMDHPHIAKVHDAGATETGRPFFVMELVRGVPITRYCAEHRLPTTARLKLFIDVCHAIQHAHEIGVIHRDIKPSNLLVARHDEIAVPKVIDFGVAKATQDRFTGSTVVTTFEQFIGTPAYMSPEQAEFGGLEIDARSDIYSLGVLLYELLTGRPPFDPKTLQQSRIDEVRRIIREDEPPRPSIRLRTLNRDGASRPDSVSPAPAGRPGPEEISSDLDWIVMKALEKDRTRRYASAGEFAQDVQRHLDHEPVTARPPSAVYVAGKFLRRHRFAVTAAALMAGTAIISTAVSGFLSDPPAAPNGATASLPAVPPVPEKSLAILPFKNQSPDPQNAAFADALHDDLLSHLFNIRELIVRSRTSVESYRDTTKRMQAIGAELGVAFVLEGSVRREGGTVQLNARMIDARTDTPRWARVFRREFSDIFALQAELATAISVELQTVLSPEEKQLLAQELTDSPEAYDLYLQGRTAFRRRKDDQDDPTVGLAKAARLLKLAIDKDPAFAAAWAELVRVHGEEYLRNHDHTRDRLEKARKAMVMVVRLAPNTVLAAAAQADFGYFTRDWTKARQHYEILLRLQPNNPENFRWQGSIFFCCRRLGLWPEAIAAARQSLALAKDQKAEEKPRGLIRVLEAGRRYEEADEEQLRWARAHPEEWEHNFDLARRAFYTGRPVHEAEKLLHGVTEEQAGSAAGIALRKRWAFTTGNLEEFVRLDQANPDPSPDPADNRLWMTAAVVYLAHGDRKAALAKLPQRAEFDARLEQQPDNDFALMGLAWAEALRGNREEALRHAAEAARLRPESVDAWTGPSANGRRAMLYAWTGDKDRSIAELTRLLRVTGSGLNIHEMKYAPVFAPLRDDPRFEALLNDPKNNAPLF